MSDSGDTEAGAGHSDLHLLSRLLIGLAYVGSDELISRLRTIGSAVAADIETYGGTIPDDESMAEMLSYLALGTMLRGQRRLARRMRQGLDLSRQAAGWALSTADRLTSNRLARPFRQSVERRMWVALLEGQQAIAEGRRESQTSRLLAERTVEELVDDVIEAMLQNPELMVSIQRLVAQQSVSLTGTVVGQTRQLTESADDVAEGIVRRVLRRGPRPPLSPTPGTSGADSAAVAGPEDDDGA